MEKRSISRIPVLLSRELRQNMTDAEVKLWSRIRAHQLDNVHFRRQHVIDRYVVDFCAPRKKLIIEVDGGHHLDQVAYDAERTAYLESLGYRVIRFWNHEVLGDIETVLEVIWSALRNDQPPSRPSPVSKSGNRGR